jgi:ArsR family transcriptional regulator, arsenate/arsenite/antimonite-responsive transcriptional repressor
MSASHLDAERAARHFAALADPTRIQIVRELAGGEQCVCDLQAALGAAQSRLSFHLGKLRRAGLVTVRREGRWGWYALEPDAMASLRGILGDLERAAREGPAHEAACGGFCCGGSG